MSLIIGLTGANAAGKGEVANLLRARGYSIHSLSDIIREVAAAEGLPPTREHLIETGNRLRRDGGPSVLADRLIPRLKAPAVVDSIRNPAEVAALRKLPTFFLLGVEATLDTRFARTLSRARVGDPQTIEEYRKREDQENAADPNAQQLKKTFALADYVLSNETTLDSLKTQLFEWIEATMAELPHRS